MRRSLALFALYTLVACGGGPPAPAAPSPDDDVLLRMAPPAGQVNRYRVTTETTTEMAGLPMDPGPMTIRQTVFQTNTVQEAEGEVRRILSVIDSVQADMGGFPGMMGQAAQMLEGLKGYATEMTITTRGEVLGTAVTDSASLADMMGSLGTLADNLGGLGPTGTSISFPEEAVQPGYAWTVPLERSSGVGGVIQAEMTGEITYRFERLEVREGVRFAVISFSGPMETSTVPDPSAPVAMDMTMSGEWSGEMELDLDGGRFGATRLTSSSVGTMSMMGQNATLSTRMTITQTPIG